MATSAPRTEVAVQRAYREQGFVVHAEPLVPADLLSRAVTHMDAVIDGEYETGVPPTRRYWNPGDDPHALVKIDFAHLSDDTLYELITAPALGEFAAAVTGADWVQVWAAQLLRKPAGGIASAAVGWHQDDNYWRNLWDGEVFTLWLAISAVTLDMGPVLYVPGSHEWGPRDGDFFSPDLSATRAAVAGDVENWSEVPAVLPAGGVSVHSRLTVHASGANTSDVARRGYAIHLRTERAQPRAGTEQVLAARLDNPRHCPVIFDARGPTLES